MQTEVFPVFDHVLAVVEDAVESFVKMRHMIATVEIVIDEHLPVTGNFILLPFYETELVQTEIACSLWKWLRKTR